MNRRLDLRVVVAGGGAVGSVLALALAREGARVTVADPIGAGQNASAIAAGMLAPAFESLFDQASPPLALLRQARDLWPALAEFIGVPLGRAGAMAVGSEAMAEAWAGTLAGLGVEAARLSASEAKQRAPWLAEGLHAVWVREDWRIDPCATLTALRSAAERAGVRRIAASVSDFKGDLAVLSGGETLWCDVLVVATGASACLAGLAPELSALTPIKGHILRAPAVPLAGPVARTEAIYVCPDAGGAVIGSTMEFGRSDESIDPSMVSRLRELAAAVAPALVGADLAARAGVRAATPDGLPLVGPSRTPGVWLAVGARRNGWLLAPLIARTLLASMTGEAPLWGAAFAPDRFRQG